MTYLNYSFTLVIILASALTSFSQQAPPIPASFFEASLVQDALNNEGCTAIRVYPVSDARSSKLTMMLIGIDKDGKELSSEISPKYKYQMFKGIVKGRGTYDPLNSSNARIACAGYSQGNHPKFVAVFQKAAVEGLLNGNGGLRISQTYSNELSNFEASGATIRQNDFPPATAPLAGEPCPHMCGDPANYVCPVN